jgi:LPXTG-motif cell wall-anchored protein
MRHLAPLVAVYALLAALVLPGSLIASEEPDSEAPVVTEAEPEEPREELAPGVANDPPQAPPAPPADLQSGPPAVAAPPADPQPAPPAEASAQAEQQFTTEPVPGAETASAANPASAAKRASRRGGARRGARARAADTAAVTIKDFEFAPATITINQGDTVTWTNDGPSAHSATATGGSFDTGVFPQGESRSHTFEAAGTFQYICTPHPNMKGTITVQAVSSGEGAGEGSADSGSSAGDSASGTGAGSGSSLPATGRDVLTLAALGLLMLAIGIVMRRSARSQSG